MSRNFSKAALRLVVLILGLLVYLPVTAFSQDHAKEHGKEKAKKKDKEIIMAATKAVAVLNPTQGNTAQGVVTFMQEEGGVHIVAKFTGVPKGEHGFHIHEFGDCSTPDGTSAGSHFNPTSATHASREAEKRHMGDMGNVTADEQGNIALDYVDKHIKLAAIIGRGMILHANPDDFTTQPTGNAGGRIACGVIGVGKP